MTYPLLTERQVIDRLSAEWERGEESDMAQTAATLYDLLREFITPPLAYSKKQDAVAKARMLLEEWKEVER